MSVYVFYAKPRSRARIHSGACMYCMEGEGREQLKDRSGVTGWSPKLSNSREAREYIRKQLPNFKDVAVCSFCNPP